MTDDQREAQIKMLPHNIRLSHKKILPCQMTGECEVTSDVEATSEVEAASQNIFPL